MTSTEKFNIHTTKKIVALIAPLDWGLGHASRCIPIITHLKSVDCDVIIASEGIQRSLLRDEFPFLQFENLRGYRISFSKNKIKTLIKILWQIPNILMSINRESRWLENFMAATNVDIIISDNRYGLFSKKIPCVFITHQLAINTPFGTLVAALLRKLNYRYINRYTECWVPDYEGPDNMGGKLSHPATMPTIPVKFLGRLSRIGAEIRATVDIRLLVILSGPEPQRSIFEKMLLAQLASYHQPVVLIRGLPGKSETLDHHHQKNLSIYNHLPATELSEFINSATFIISRSGYSSIMDFMGLNKKCIFVPTPGQSEQEYLAAYLSSKNFCLSYDQDRFKLDDAIKKAETHRFSNFEHSENDAYKEAITAFISNIRAGN